MLDLLYEEYCLNLENGLSVDIERLIGPHSHVKYSFHRLVEVHSFVGDAELPNAISNDLPSNFKWPKIGSQVHDFQIESQLGRGALARVYLAREIKLDRLVAVKVAPNGFSEAQQMSKLDHPNIVSIYYVEEDDEGVTSICMPYHGSATLADVMDLAQSTSGIPARACDILKAVTPFELPDPVSNASSPEYTNIFEQGSYAQGIASLGIDLARALSHSHAQGIIHSDLKPSNILVTPRGNAMLLDFNLSRDLNSQQVRIGGTLPYMAPEQIRNVMLNQAAFEVDARSDVYSLGVIFCELLTGQSLFPMPKDVATREELAEFAMLQRVKFPGAHYPNQLGVRSLAGVIRQCLQPDPNKRPQTAAELRDLLGACLPSNPLTRRVAISAMIVGLAGPIAYAVSRYDADEPKDQILVDPLEEGIALIERRDYANAEKVLSRELRKAIVPNRRALLYARATALRLDRKYQDAIGDYEQVVSLQHSDLARFCLGFCYGVTKQHQSANFHFKMVHGGQLTPPTRLNLAYLDLRIGAYRTAELMVESYANKNDMNAARLKHIELLIWIDRVRRVIDPSVRERLRQVSYDTLKLARRREQVTARVLYNLAVAAELAHDGKDAIASKRLLEEAVTLGWPKRWIEVEDFNRVTRESWFQRIMAEGSASGALPGEEFELLAPPPPEADTGRLPTSADFSLVDSSRP